MTTPAQPTQREFDIVIVGGSFSAPAAALQAARANPDARVLILEPMDWLGGQATSQGVAAIDNAWHNPGATLMRENREDYYPEDYLDFIERIKNTPAEAPGEGYGGDGCSWVSRESYDPRSAAWILDRMMEEHENITVMKLTVLKQVETEPVTDEFGEGLRITGLTAIERTPRDGYKPFTKFLSEELPDWYSAEDSEEFTKSLHHIVPRDREKGMVVIDASELADAIVLSGAVYTVGRELTTEQMGEDGSLPAMNEHGSQSFVFVFCATDAETPDPEEDVKDWFANFSDYYQEQVENFFSMGAHSWERIWTYRRLRNMGAPYSFDSVHRGDVSMQNWYPGNDYPHGTLFKDKADTAAELDDWRGGVNIDDIAKAEKHAVGWYFYYKDHRTTGWDTRYLYGDDPLNMMDTGHGLAKFPYIRCTRRIVGLENFRLRERYFEESSGQPGSSFRFYDSIGIGNYAVDIHPTHISSGMVPSYQRPLPFYIPYRALGSANVRNLLAAGKTPALTFITNSAYRLHPIEWALGTATGAAAAMMNSGGLTNYDLLELERLRELQGLVAENSPIHWKAYDGEVIPPKDGDLVVNDLRPAKAGKQTPIEVYHHRAVRGEIFVNGTRLGETSYRANGRLLLETSALPEGDVTVRAVCYGADGEQLAVLEADVAVEPADPPYTVIDDVDPGFSTTGDWTQASAQPDKYGPTYHYSEGGHGENTATWEFPIAVPGKYRISVWYPAAFNRATDSPFTVHHAEGETLFKLNQQERGGQWNELGSFRFDTQGGKVVLSNNVEITTQLVLADAIRIEIIDAPGFEGWIVR